MPRGNTSDNRNKSPIIGDAGISASSDEIAALTRNMRDNLVKGWNRPAIDLHNPDDVKTAIYDYLTDCEKNSKRPGNMGMYRALGLSRQDVSDVIRGKNKSKVSPECIDIIKSALQSMSEYREQLGLQGRLNPVTLLFWQKNYDGLSDVQHIDIQTDRSDIPRLTQEDIAKRIPVYSDIEQDDA